MRSLGGSDDLSETQIAKLLIFGGAVVLACSLIGGSLTIWRGQKVWKYWKENASCITTLHNSTYI
jgi:hypothetical protein